MSALGIGLLAWCEVLVGLLPGLLLHAGIAIPLGLIASTLGFGSTHFEQTRDRVALAGIVLGAFAVTAAVVLFAFRLLLAGINLLNASGLG